MKQVSAVDQLLPLGMNTHMHARTHAHTHTHTQNVSTIIVAVFKVTVYGHGIAKTEILTREQRLASSILPR